jgi:hypothetical protein
MLTAPNIEQARSGECRYCGIRTVAGSRGPIPDCCPPCRTAYKTEWARQHERKPAKRAANGRTYRTLERRKALGISGIGERMACCECRLLFTKTASTSLYCASCRQELKKRRQREKFGRYTDERRAEYREQDRLRKLARYRASPHFALNQRMSSAIAKSLASGKEGRSWESLVGYTIADLMPHLEAQFLPGMTWENRGEWHIDHIRPLCSFSFQTPDDPQFREAWALTNLQPLWARDNLSKGGRYTPGA